MNDLITIVVPVYNVEKYLPHTLEVFVDKLIQIFKFC